VLFGMVKFLIFDTCADYILAQLPPGSADSVAVSLGVSLLSGAIAGVGAAVVSQPADVVLSRVAQGEGPSKVVGKLPGGVNQFALLQQTAKTIVRSYGLAGLYLGLPSRCIWSGAIIAGQFFLYDVFKAALHVTAADLTLFYDAMGAAALGTGGTL
jgi:solute carrier family 25 phosphate transporter 3